jgi:hypothetical protein
MLSVAFGLTITGSYENDHQGNLIDASKRKHDQTRDQRTARERSQCRDKRHDTPYARCYDSNEQAPVRPRRVGAA